MELLKEWENYDEYARKCKEFLRDWYKFNLTFRAGTEHGKVDEIFGLAYTSTSDYAALWCTNSTWEYKSIPGYYFRGVAISEFGFAYAVLYCGESDFYNPDLFVPIGNVFYKIRNYQGDYYV